MKRRAVVRGMAVGLVAIVAVCARLEAQSWRTVTASRQRGDERDLSVRVTYGAGRLTVGLAPAGLLYRMQLRYDEDLFEPLSEFDGRNLRLGVERRGRSIRIGRYEGGELQVELAQSVPTRLALEFGAGRADVDLGGLSLTALDVHTGAAEAAFDVSRPNPVALETATFQVGAADFTARRLGNLNARRIEVNAGVGKVRVDLTGAWRQNADVHVQMGLGSLELRFPERLGVKLQQKTFLTSVDTESLVKRGDAYYSLDWEDAARRITVQIDAAFGNVDVRWVR